MVEPKQSKTRSRVVEERSVQGGLPVLRPDAAGIDVGSRSHYVAVPHDRDANPVREFASFTTGLESLAKWLEQCNVKTVAMESTGVFWIPVYELLEARGFEVLLVCSSHLRNVPGRKSDVMDCRWIQQLHSFGLLRPSFRPGADFVELRAYMRQRTRIIDDGARYVQHMQKALMQMNLQLHHVITDICGQTGMRIIRAIVNGERDGQKLAGMRDGRCHNPVEVIAAALQGNYKAEHLFALTQALDAYDFCEKQLKECDERIAAKLDKLQETAAHMDGSPLPAARKRPRHGHQPTFDVRGPLHRICGDVDLTQIPGIAPATALELVAEIGTDMTRWRTEKHFTAWLNLAPGTKKTGNKLISGRRSPAKNRAGAALRQAAVSVGRTKTALGGFYRRLASHRSGLVAAVATARKLAILVYNALKHGQKYVEQSLADYERQQHERKLRYLQKLAADHGFNLQPIASGDVVT